jgi:hypothetical protein
MKLKDQFNYLTVSTTCGKITLEKITDTLWKGSGLSVKIQRQDTAEKTVLLPVIHNDSVSDVHLDEVEVVRLQIPPPLPVRFMRFGLNMPGDPVFFGTLDKTGFNEAILPLDSQYISEDDSVISLSSNSLLLVSPTGSKEITLIGAGTFKHTEGTICLSCEKTTGDVFVSYVMKLDGVRLISDESRSLDTVVIMKGNDLNQVLNAWAEFTAFQVKPLIPEFIPTGWNDWQYYRNEKTQRDVLDSSEVIASLKRKGYPLDYSQVDGGFCMHLSEWSKPKSAFDMGIVRLSEEIRGMGLKFGLWLAPYIQNINTNVVKEHPDWLLLSKDGVNPVQLPNSNVGPSCLIDYSVPGTLEWLRQLVRMFVKDWGVSWIKLDGPNYNLYRLGSLRNPSLTMTEMLATTFDLIREEAGPNVLVEGEGMMGIALGRVDLHRVQTDNQPDWYRNFDKRSPYAPLVYGKELLMSFIHNKWWCNHRENIILRDFPSPFCHASGQNPFAVEQIFTDNELKTQLTVAFLGSGGLLLTDPMKELLKNPERMAYIHKLLPVWPQAAEIVDAFPKTRRFPSIYKMIINLPHEDYVIVGVINWGDLTEEVTLSFSALGEALHAGKEYYAFSFYDEKVLDCFNENIHFGHIPSHGSKLVALREKRNHPQVLSTNMHLSQGAVELDQHTWNAEKNLLTIHVKHFHQTDAKLYLSLPAPWKIQNISTNASRFVIEDFNPLFPILHFDGVASSNASTFDIHCDTRDRG